MPPKRKTVTFAPLPIRERDNFRDSSSTSSDETFKIKLEAEPKVKSQHRKTMTEPRARAARHKGQLNFKEECTLFSHQPLLKIPLFSIFIPTAP